MKLTIGLRCSFMRLSLESPVHEEEITAVRTLEEPSQLNELG